jgi:hypothetical protein
MAGVGLFCTRLIQAMNNATELEVLWKKLTEQANFGKFLQNRK